MQFRLRKKLSFQDFFAKLSMKKELWDSTETNNSSMVIKAIIPIDMNFYTTLGIWIFGYFMSL